MSAVMDSLRRVVRALRTSARTVEQRLGVSGAQLFVLAKLAEALARSALAGYFEATPNALSCSSDASCASATCPFGTCGCFVAMAPATVSEGHVEGPGMLVQYSNGTFQFEKALGPLALVQPAGDGTFIAQPLWNNIVVGQSWTVNLLPPTTPNGTPSPCSNTVMGITPGATPGTTPATTPGVTPNIVWQSPWSCAYPPPPAPATPNTMIITESTSLSVPRTFLEPIPRWSSQPSPTETPTPTS